MTKTDENQLTSRQLMALPFFANSSSVEAACKLADVSKDTFYKWLKEPLFKVELERLRSEVVTEAINQLKISATKAATTLSTLLDREDSPGVQRAAANDILGHVMKFMELKEIEERLTLLEGHVKGRK